MRRDSVAMIVEGATRALARSGVRKLSMSDICAEAGVSRGTLYRYFKDKNEVLTAVGDHVRDSLAKVLQEAVAEQPDPRERLQVVLQAMLGYRDHHPHTVTIVATEPMFALDFFRRSQGHLVATVAEALAPVLDASAAVDSGRLTRLELADIFHRLVLSCYLIPSPGADDVVQAMAEAWASTSSFDGSAAAETARSFA